MLVVCSLMMFARVIPQVFGPRVPIHNKVFFIYLIARLKTSHIEHARYLAADCAIDNTCEIEHFTTSQQTLYAKL